MVKAFTNKLTSDFDGLTKPPHAFFPFPKRMCSVFEPMGALQALAVSFQFYCKLHRRMRAIA